MHGCTTTCATTIREIGLVHALPPPIEENCLNSRFSGIKHPISFRRPSYFFLQLHFQRCNNKMTNSLDELPCANCENMDFWKWCKKVRIRNKVDNYLRLVFSCSKWWLAKNYCLLLQPLPSSTLLGWQTQYTCRYIFCSKCLLRLSAPMSRARRPIFGVGGFYEICKNYMTQSRDEPALVHMQDNILNPSF